MPTPSHPLPGSGPSRPSGPGTGGPHIEPGPHGTLPAQHPVTLTGKVTHDPDGRCLLLVAGDTAYELQGQDEVLPVPGTRATVIGRVDRTLTSHCGGTPVLVQSTK